MPRRRWLRARRGHPVQRRAGRHVARERRDAPCRPARSPSNSAQHERLALGVELRLPVGERRQLDLLLARDVAHRLDLQLVDGLELRRAVDERPARTHEAERQRRRRRQRLAQVALQRRRRGRPREPALLEEPRAPPRRRRSTGCAPSSRRAPSGARRPPSTARCRCRAGARSGRTPTVSHGCGSSACARRHDREAAVLGEQLPRPAGPRRSAARQRRRASARSSGNTALRISSQRATSALGLRDPDQ